MSKQFPPQSGVLRTPGVAMITAVLAVLLFVPATTSAQTCIQDVWKAHGNNQKLNCTAQDVTLSSATNIDIKSGGSCPVVNGVKTCSCFAGQTVQFTADFRMDLTADTRYDVGFYIETGLDTNKDGALTGTCSANASLATNTSAANFINLDNPSQPGDVCGDITGPSGGAHNPLIVTATITTQCPSTPGTKLALPFATTWRQPGSNEVCDGSLENPGIGNGTTSNDVYPGAPSKCNVGSLVIDITSVETKLEVKKTTTTTSVPESTGGDASYTAEVKNTTTIPITLTSLVDAPYGDITQVGGGITATTCVPDANPATCEVGGTIAAGATCSCTFTATVPPGDSSGPDFADTVTACAINDTSSTEVCGSDGAEVPYSDVSSPPTLTKLASNTACIIDQTYDVTVTNTNALETLTLKTLLDDIYGNITQVQGDIQSTTCGQSGAGKPGALPAVIAPAGSYNCSFVARSTSCSGTVLDTVTATTEDSDGILFSPFDDASVTITVSKP